MEAANLAIFGLPEGTVSADDLISRIAKRLRQPLPGEEAQYRMAPHYRVRGSYSEIDTAQYRHSAVLAVFCKRNGHAPFIPLTMRQEYDGPHSSQVSLPGGRYDEMDGSLANTALRECYEEIGIKDNVEIIGKLSNLHIPVSRFIVHPFVAVYHSKEVRFQSHEREVKMVIEAPVEALMNKKNCISATFPSYSGPVEAPCFLLDGHLVWGATAMILNELRQVMKESLEQLR